MVAVQGRFFRRRDEGLTVIVEHLGEFRAWKGLQLVTRHEWMFALRFQRSDLHFGRFEAVLDRAPDLATQRAVLHLLKNSDAIR